MHFDGQGNLVKWIDKDENITRVGYVSAQDVQRICNHVCMGMGYNICGPLYHITREEFAMIVNEYLTIGEGQFELAEN